MRQMQSGFVQAVRSVRTVCLRQSHSGSPTVFGVVQERRRGVRCAVHGVKATTVKRPMPISGRWTATRYPQTTGRCWQRMGRVRRMRPARRMLEAVDVILALHRRRCIVFPKR